MISTVQLSKSFGSQKVLREISIDFKRGRSTALIGPNGSGKTTLIKSILGMVKPDAGDITVNGKSVINKSDYRRHIGYMPQIQRFPEHMQVRQLFALMRKLRSDIAPDQYDLELYDSFKIEQMGSKRLGQLSGGMKQKVSAALAFLFNPQALILDEPTAGLDPLSNEVLKDKLKSAIDAGKLVLITSHILSDLDEITTDVAYLIDGMLAFYKSLAELKKQTSEQRLNRMIAQVLQNQSEYV